MVRDPDVKHQLARLNRQAWSLYRRIGQPRARGDLGQARILAAVQWQADHFEDAPVDHRRLPHTAARCLRPPVAGPRSYYGSIFPAVQNLLLAARALGLGAALTTLPLWSPCLARRTLGLPAPVTPCAVIPLGWPRAAATAPRPAARSRRSISTATGTGVSGKLLNPVKCTRRSPPAAG